MNSSILEQGIVQALNGILGKEYVITNDEKSKLYPIGACVKSMDVDNIFGQFYQRVVDPDKKLEIENFPAFLPPAPRPKKAKIYDQELLKDEFKIYVSTLTNNEVTLHVSSGMFVEDLKPLIQDKVGVPPDQQCIIFAGKQLEDGQTLAHYKIRPEAKLHLVLSLRGGGMMQLFVDMQFFDPQWDFDFRKIKDDNKVFKRNKFVYQRPLNSMRYAIKVLGKYENNDWLGQSGNRTDTDGKEWPVAYHGTLEMNALGIVRDGFRLDKGVRFLYGKGIYCTPNPKAALFYAQRFMHEGKHYRLIIQTRVNPDLLKIVRTEEDDPNHAEYWLLPDEKAIRPYGICIYEA